MEKIVKSIPELEAFAQSFINSFVPRKEGATLVCLKGDLGAGKTAFTKAAGKALGVMEHITSPTFVLMKRFMIHESGFRNLIHIDAYRLEKGEQLKKLGWEQLLSDPGNLILLEWPERVFDILPPDALTLNFEFIDEQTRKIYY